MLLGDEVNLQINKIRVVESLGLQDLKTGREIKEHCEFYSSIEDIQYTSTVTLEAFIANLESLVVETKQDDCILLFLETHGSVEGVEVAGQHVSWLVLNRYISEINERSCCGLIVVFSCCFGVNFYQQTDILKQAPYLLMFGVDTSISSSNLLSINKLIASGLFSGKCTTEIELECNEFLEGLGVNLIYLNAESFLYAVMERFLLEAVDERILDERLSSFLTRFRLEYPTVQRSDNEINKLYVNKLLSLENMENRFYDKKEKFLLTDKYFHLNERFSLDFDTLYETSSIDETRRHLLQKYSVT